jgi:hypothetical protein
LRGVEDSKTLRHRLSGDPDNPILRVDHQREAIPLGSWNLAVDEKVLQFPHTGGAERSEPIPWLPISHA